MQKAFVAHLSVFTLGGLLTMGAFAMINEPGLPAGHIASVKLPVVDVTQFPGGAADFSPGEVDPPPFVIAGPLRDLQPKEVKTKTFPVSFQYEATDTTGNRQIRTQEIKIGVDYNLAEAHSVGVGVAKEFADSGDAGVWGEDAVTDEQAFVKYKMKF